MTTEKLSSLLTKSIYILSSLVIALFYTVYWMEGWIGVFLFTADVAFLFILLALLIARLVGIIYLQKISLLPPLLFGILAIGVIIFRPIEYLLEKLKSPVILSGHCEMSSLVRLNTQQLLQTMNWFSHWVDRCTLINCQT